MQERAFLKEAGHRVRFVFIPRYCSWLNQIENWFSGLSLWVLRRDDFVPVEAQRSKILSYIAFDNPTAEPMR